jgi:hypothetical protein
MTLIKLDTQDTNSSAPDNSDGLDRDLIHYLIPYDQI